MLADWAADWAVLAVLAVLAATPVPQHTRHYSCTGRSGRMYRWYRWSGRAAPDCLRRVSPVLLSHWGSTTSQSGNKPGFRFGRGYWRPGPLRASVAQSRRSVGRWNSRVCGNDGGKRPGGVVGCPQSDVGLDRRGGDGCQQHEYDNKQLHRVWRGCCRWASPPSYIWLQQFNYFRLRYTDGHVDNGKLQHHVKN